MGNVNYIVPVNSMSLMDQRNYRQGAVIKGMDYFYSLGLQYPISQSVLVVLSAVAIFTRNERFHSGFVLVALGYMVFSGFSFYETVG